MSDDGDSGSRGCRNAKVVGSVPERLLTLKNLHIAGVAVSGAVCVYLLAHMAYAWQTAKNQDAGALAQERLMMQRAEVAARPLAGLDEKLKLATVEADGFYARRLPFANSEVLGELGGLATKHGVKLTRVQYAYEPELEGTKSELTELRMDASLSETTGRWCCLSMHWSGTRCFSSSAELRWWGSRAER